MNPSDPDPAKNSAFSKWMAFVLDDLIRVPGTKRRFGLDPLLGLIPGVGDFITSSAGLTLLAAGAKKSLPINVYLRMIANWILNALVGALPLIGDVFSFWFKSNRRNYELLQAHLSESGSQKARRSSWLPLLILTCAVLLVFVILASLAVWSWRTIFG